MKFWFVFPLVFLAGLLIGGLQPRGELRRLRQELETRKKVENTPPAQSRQLASFLSMLPVDTPVRDPERDHARVSTSRVETAETDNGTATGHVAQLADTRKNRAAMTPEERAEAFKARMEQAAEAWRLRAEIARSGFASKTGFTDKEMMDFDVLMKSMNVRLEDLFIKTAEQLKAGDPFTPETGIRLVNGLTESMVLTYSEMDRKLPATWRKDAGASFDLVTYVDPVVVKPLVEVQDKLPAPGEMRRNRFGGGPPPPSPFRP